MAAQVGDASGSIGRILEDQAQRGGRQAGGWLLFDAALVWVWFGFLSGFGFGLFWYNVGVVCPWLSVGGSGYCTGPKSIIL